MSARIFKTVNCNSTKSHGENLLLLSIDLPAPVYEEFFVCAWGGASRVHPLFLINIRPVNSRHNPFARHDTQLNKFGFDINRFMLQMGQLV